mmetsp:Transcript_960/g.1446  ORF Transcript_960/g.1446 Transcript_960/m.1446 type:complete len:211 (-) Transcript_960:140-772(-)|eukprot:CAMPEP_0184857516 /NCGR_PEP_ID=MMETSP0580-20130426/2665_1 /TAXON_ID=1118495 /ORGANISM="Dactyliosolen fragilissimus" /LENGTH=210 /DNA_ID=CAMNT_0027353147 /DNA_START=14 /DNA_END=646 /DNA_ORIENTATION=+
MGMRKNNTRQKLTIAPTKRFIQTKVTSIRKGVRKTMTSVNLAAVRAKEKVMDPIIEKIRSFRRKLLLTNFSCSAATSKNVKNQDLGMQIAVAACVASVLNIGGGIVLAAVKSGAGVAISAKVVDEVRKRRECQRRRNMWDSKYNTTFTSIPTNRSGPKPSFSGRASSTGLVTERSQSPLKSAMEDARRNFRTLEKQNNSLSSPICTKKKE